MGKFDIAMLLLVIALVAGMIFGMLLMSNSIEVDNCRIATSGFPQYQPFLLNSWPTTCYMQIITTDDRTLYLTYSDFTRALADPRK